MKNLFLVRIVVHFTKSKVRNRRFKNIWIFFSYVFVLSNFYRTFILIFLQMIRLYFSIIVSRFWEFSSHHVIYLPSILSISLLPSPFCYFYQVNRFVSHASIHFLSFREVKRSATMIVSSYLWLTHWHTNLSFLPFF